MRFVFLDTETTGFNRSRDNGEICDNHRIIEIGCIEMIDGELTGRTFHKYLDPKIKIDPKATKVHGLEDSFIKGKPSFKDIASDFIRFISDAVIVIHNAPFDIAFIDKEFTMLPQKLRPSITFHYIDTLVMARERFPGMKNSLDALGSDLGISTEKRRHRALDDATLLAKVYSKLKFT
ncbi:DNA polymerase exonuclease subunit [Pinkberry virus LS07-2018-MD00]|jgi:DNA polymerase-3 subunit epsilon|nr:DNA polymerase exonuclease subunit [Pinkberry virus LS07-2018-MD00]